MCKDKRPDFIDRSSATGYAAYMGKIDYEKELNPQQMAAVAHGEGPALVIAGAGTGKTRTLIYRVAKLVEDGVDPKKILLLTFTRRASNEMLKRAGELVSDSRAKDVAGGTFHAFANVVLRKYGRVLGIPPNFSVIDRSDAEDILQHLRTELGFAGERTKDQDPYAKPRRFPRKRTLMKIISKATNTQKSVTEIIKSEWPQFNEDAEDIVAVAAAYRKYKGARQLMDYDDLLVWLERLLTKSVPAQQKLAAQYSHILVDEYQDTNRVQADILRALASHKNIMAVGDDAQAIYSFRGASFKNIMQFDRDFPGAKIYRIEENYRSTEPILHAANAVIARAPLRHAKELFSKREGGKTPRMIGLDDEHMQASFIADEILRLREEGVELEEIAVLFRSGYHSFELEAELQTRNIPFVKWGGFKFAEAAHVKDALAHLRWVVNRGDIVAAQRCLLLLDGVGAVTARNVADAVADSNDLVAALSDVPVSQKAAAGIKRLAKALAEVKKFEKPAEQLEALMPYLLFSIRARFDDWPKRMRDLEHLVGIAKRFRSTERFTSDFSLDPPADHTVVGVSGTQNEEEPLVLSTIHSAKGLEWKAVFVLSVLDGYLPQDYAFSDEAMLEEERRLLYVAMTRAKDELTITYPMTIIPGNNRAMLSGDRIYGKPSHFLDGLETDGVLEHVVMAGTELFGPGILSDIQYGEEK